MSHEKSLKADDDAEFVREIMLIMAVWTVAVVIAGILLVALQGPFAAVFAMAGLLV